MYHIAFWNCSLSQSCDDVSKGALFINPGANLSNHLCWYRWVQNLSRPSSRCTYMYICTCTCRRKCGSHTCIIIIHVRTYTQTLVLFTCSTYAVATLLYSHPTLKPTCGNQNLLHCVHTHPTVFGSNLRSYLQNRKRPRPALWPKRILLSVSPAFNAILYWL